MEWKVLRVISPGLDGETETASLWVKIAQLVSGSVRISPGAQT